uniref:RNase H type-1 domain-containing protein n=1 Tax=Fagus sylvatica TaxID=28930 RepID=A0A2N9HN36_FAGSY
MEARDTSGQHLNASDRQMGEIQIPIPGKNGGEGPRNEEGRNQNQDQNDEGSSANQNRIPRPSQVVEPTRFAADARATRLEEDLKEMRDQMKEMKSQVKAKAAKNLDMLVHHFKPPFTKKVDEYPLPTKFKLEIGSIDTFTKLSRAFIDNFIGGRRLARPANYLLNIRQREGESLRSYVQRFNKEAVQIDEPSEYVALTVFNAGLRKGDFLFQLCKDPPRSMSELMYEAQKFINTEDTFEAWDEFPNKKRKELEDRRFESSKSRPRKNLKMDDQIITFSENDARGIHQPHDNALVVTMTIVSFLTRRVLIDNGSSVDIIYLPAYQQMKIDKERLRPIDIPLVGFTGDKVKPSGVVSFMIEAGTRPTFNKLRVVTLTYHLLVRFPTEHGIGELKGNQTTARECYFTSLGPETRHQTMTINEEQKLVEPNEELKVVVLDDEKPNKTTNIETRMGGRLRESIIEFLKSNIDVFTWTHDDMLGFIREVYYPNWLANVVMVKKSNGKWRMCVDFTDLNKACLKDSFPLPRINRLVDSTAGHRLLTFMDAFSGYNQIMMDEDDQDKTSFITSKWLFCYKEMPFGLKNAEATYQRLMNKMFHNQIGQNVEVYIDDMLVKTKDEENHLDDLEETFRTLRQYHMKLNPNERQKSFEELKMYLTSPPLLSPFKQSETLSLYLAVSPTAISSALIREEDGVQLLIYYASKAFQGVDERYLAMEKLALALVAAARKLRPYFQAHTIIVLTNHPLCKAMNKPDATGRLIQWAIELSEFDIEYCPRQAIKAQAFADFIAEFTVAEEESSQEKSEGKWEVKINGSSVKGAGGVGIVFKMPKGHLLKHAVWLQYPTTNNEAEYKALLIGLRISQVLGATTLRVQSDSQLVVGQVNGEYEAKEDRMAKYLGLVKNIMTRFDEVVLVQIPQEQNTEADALAKLTSSEDAINQQIKIQYSPSHTEEKMNPIVVNNSWMTPITKYLKEGTLPTDVVEARKLKVRSARFGNLVHSPPEVLTPITAPWPFAQWGLDIMGPFLIGRKQMKFLVVGIDYFMKTTVITPTGETPFRLTFGTEAVILVEIGLTSFRTNEYDEDGNNNQLRLNLDLLDEARDQAKAKTKAYQQMMARYHDRRVKHREFKVGDLVLRKVTLATKDPTQGKLGPT